MCGIIGYIGKEEAVPPLMEGLRRESYRGYDSSGIVVFGKTAQCVKAVGKLENLEKKITDGYPTGHVGIGHCLVPDTLVFLADGRITEISNVKDGEYVISINQKTSKLEKGKVRVFKHQAPEEIYHIRTSSGYVKASREHRMFVATENGLIAKRVVELKEGDLLVFPKKIPVNTKKIRFEKVAFKKFYRISDIGKETLTLGLKNARFSQLRVAALSGVNRSYVNDIFQGAREVEENQLRSVCSVLDVEFLPVLAQALNTARFKLITLPEESSPELMQIIGYFLGDGNVGSNYLRFTDANIEVLQRYQELIAKTFTVAGTIRKRSDSNAYILEIISTPLAEWFRINVRQREPVLVEKLGMTSQREIRAFIRGFFDAEGTVSVRGRNISIDATHEKLMRTLQFLFLRIGMPVSLLEIKSGRKNEKKRFRVSLANLFSLNLFYGLVSFTSSQKQKKLREVLTQKRSGDARTFKVIPMRKRELYERGKQFLSTSETIRALGGYLDGFITQRRLKVFIGTLKKYSQKSTNGELSKYIAFLGGYLMGNFVYSPVESIKNIKSEFPYLYDLEVEPHANFFANGLLSHNSRWATHGSVNEANCHPHQDCKGNIFVVHNGIIENYQVLKEKLEAKGHRFLSQTDTEVLPHLIEHFFQANLEKAVRKALQVVKGTYGIAVIAREDPGKIVAARLSSPLVLSINSSGGFVASDPAALISHSNKMVFLDDKEVAVIQPDKFLVTDIYNKLREKEITELEWTLEEAQKGGYPHFLLKEIMEQPESLANALRGRLLADEGMVKLGGLDPFKERLREIERIQMLACGSASYASRVGEYMLEEYAGIPTETDIASEFRYRKPVFDKKTLSIFVSQSGETADTLAALHEVKEKGGLTLGVVNVVGSSVARGVDMGIYTHAGAETAVASTKAFIAQIAVMALIAVYLGRQRQLSLVMGQRIVKELARIPDLVRQVLLQAEQVQKVAQKYQKFSNFFLIGRKYNNPIALEGALKLKETAYVHAEGTGGGELKHGSLALIDASVPTIAIVLSDSVYEKMVSAIQEIKARNGKIIAIATQGNEDIKNIADDVLYIPKTLEMLTPILTTVPLQLLAYHIGVLKGNDVDKPRNLAKSVTVE